MTPAITLLKKAKVSFATHTYEVDPKAASYGQGAADALNISADIIFKTLVVSLNDDPKNLGVAVIPVAQQLNLKKAASALGAKKAQMADGQIVQKTTGYVLGGVSPFGQKKRLPTVLDKSALALETLYCSAGKRGLQISLNPQDLLTLLSAKPASICD